METKKQATKNVTDRETKKTASVGKNKYQSVNAEDLNEEINSGANVINTHMEGSEQAPTADVESVENVEKEEKKEPTFIADAKDKKPKEYASRVQIAARYTDEQAKNMLRKKIAQCKEVHLRFLQKIEDPSAFKIEKRFIPVHCGKTDVRYSWKTTVNKVESWHEEICMKENRFSSAKKDLDVTNFVLGDLPQVAEKKESELIENNSYTFKTTTRSFDNFLKTTAPAKGAEIEKRGETYTLVYVPIMKTTCTLDGEKYVGYVNLYNGACYSAYKVSDFLEKAAEKAATAAKFAKRTLWSTFLFTLTFCLLTLFGGLKSANWNFGALAMKTVWVTFELGGLAVPSLLLIFGENAVKKASLIEKAISTGRRPTTAWSRFATVVGVLCTIVAVLLFFFQVMI